jgi:hypothetical protein
VQAWKKVFLFFIPVLFISNVLILPVSISKSQQPIEESQDWAQVPLTSYSVTEAALVSGSPVQILDLQLPWPQVFNLNLVELNEQPVSTMNEIVLDTGDVLRITGMYSDLSVIAQSQGSSSIIEVMRSTEQGTSYSTLTALPSSNQNKEVKVASPNSIWVNKTTLLGAVKDNYLSDPVILDFTLSQRSLNTNDVTSNVALLSKGTAVAALNWLAFFSVFVLAGFFWLIGVFLWNSKLPNTPADHFLRILLGFTLFGLTINTANFFLPGVQATLLAIATILSLAAFKIKRLKSSARYLFDLKDRFREFLRISLTTVVPLLIAFWPIFLFGLRFSGETKTDFSEYATLASFLRDSSMLAMQKSAEAQSSGILTSGAGFSWRSIDSAISSAFGTALGGNSFFGITALSVLALYLFTIGIIALFNQDSKFIATKNLFWVSLLASYPILLTISVESYLSQFVFICLMPAVIVSITYHLKTPNDKAGIWALSALLAFLGALYPYFLAITLVGVCISLLVNSKQTRIQLRNLVVQTSLRTALLLNVAVLPIIFYFESNTLHTALNDIARVTLLGPYSSLERIGLIGGVTTYEWRHWTEVPGEYIGFVTTGLWKIGSLINNPMVLLFLILLVIALTLGTLYSIIRTPRVARISNENHILISVFVAWTSAFVFYAATDSTYVALKMVGVVIVSFIVLMSSLIKSVPKSKLVLACAGLFVIWLPVNILERAHWLIDPLMPEVRYSHVTTVYQIDALRSFLSVKDYGSVSVAYGEEPLQGSDRDRVLIFNTKTVLRDLRIDCLDCENTLPIKDVACDADQSTPLVVIGSSSFDKGCNRKEVFSSGLITIFE